VTPKENHKTSIWRQFPSAFWVANIMEIFERMGWYGFYAVSSIYLTGPIAEGGLGLSSQDRGVIQGLATFFLYLFPALFGALADRYGYRRMFLTASAVMVPAYLLLGVPTSFWGFFGVYILVAVGHGMFKPVVISTVTKATDEKTGTMGFGIFYMMVNVGGFIGPIIAGIVRGWSWRYVFLASAAWTALVGLSAALFYKEPQRDLESESQRGLSEVLAGMVEVVGNGRFFLLIVGLLTTLVMGSKWWSFQSVAWVAAVWLILNFAYDAMVRSRSGSDGPWYLAPMKIGEGRFLLFLLLMSSFWTSFKQIFITLPLYIRDYVETSDLVTDLHGVAMTFTRIFESLGVDTSTWAKAVLENGQVKPEHLINLNAFGIIIGQILISWLARNLKPFTTIIAGISITVVSFTGLAYGKTGWMIVAGILIFSLGEMLASPKAKEYAGRIAPPDKVGMYMGYFYWCVALGNLFGGLLSGMSYHYFGPQGIDRPNLMWLLFAAIALGSALALALYNRWVHRTVSSATP
jgi:proton-dependent oligopeptide transporter, POT family